MKDKKSIWWKKREENCLVWKLNISKKRESNQRIGENIITQAGAKWMEVIFGSLSSVPSRWFAERRFDQSLGALFCG